VDASGAIYFEVGNGNWDGKRDFGTSLINVRLRGHANYQALNDRDADLGSTGPLLVPGTNFLIAGSNRGILYLFADGRIVLPLVAKGAIGNRGSPGGTLNVSSDGKRVDTGIVCATHTNNKSADHGNAPGVLRAFDAGTLLELSTASRNPGGIGWGR
jgi:hypothetical protein